MTGKIWSEEDSEKLQKLYAENTDIDAIAAVFGKNSRSIVSKLVQLRVYKKPQVELEKTRRVKDMLKELETILDISLEEGGLTKKSNLEKVVDALKIKLQYDYN